jgi:hypothetical protein
MPTVKIEKPTTANRQSMEGCQVPMHTRFGCCEDDRLTRPATVLHMPAKPAAHVKNSFRAASVDDAKLKIALLSVRRSAAS